VDIAGASGIPETRGLDEFATEEAALASPALMSMVGAAPSPADRRPRAFSRVEAAHRRRARSSVAARMRRHAVAWRWRLLQFAGILVGYFWTVVAWLALRCTSLSYGAARIAHRRRRPREVATAPSPAVSIAPGSNAVPAAPHTEFEVLESERSVIAAALALAVVGYGALLLMSWGDPLPRVAAASAAPDGIVIDGASAPEPAAMLASRAAANPTRAIHAVIADGSPATVDLGRSQPRVSAASLKAIWNRADTRSLQGALTSLRHQTLAFHRCGMKMTGVDQAVARCDASSRAYTIDFQRTSGRWMIQRVSSR